MGLLEDAIREHLELKRSGGPTLRGRPPGAGGARPAAARRVRGRERARGAG